ncbi:hypothetical protein [Streptosporangium sp. NPDC004631]
MDANSRRKIVRNYIATLDGANFQAMCDRLAALLYPGDYQPVRVAGAHGDTKNDGYCPKARTFFAAHATRGESAKKTKAKIQSDLEGCLAQHRDVRTWRYLTNDTLTGEVDQFIDNQLRPVHPGVAIEIWGHERLTDEICSLPLSAIEQVTDINLATVITASAGHSRLPAEAWAMSQGWPPLNYGNSIDCRSIENRNPLELGVHAAVLPASHTYADNKSDEIGLTPYFERDHDRKLRRELGRAIDLHRSIMVVFVGGSTVGKTRALFETLRTVPIVRSWPMICPADTDELSYLLKNLHLISSQTSEPPHGVVWWLDETQRFLYGHNSSQVANVLTRLLATESNFQHVIAGTLWREPYFSELTAQGVSPDTHSAARTLLTGPHTRVISVPGHFTAEQCESLAEHYSDDQRLLAAFSSAGDTGNVIQNLAGGPELLSAYLEQSIFTASEIAITTAALDASRLGHRQPLPIRLLQQAAEGYLKPQHRPLEEDWSRTDVMALIKGARLDGSRTDIRKTLTAITPYKLQVGGKELACRPADYLDHQMRRIREEKTGPPSLWDALLTHTYDGDDLSSLGEAAHRFGLYRYAIALWRRAVQASTPRAALHILRVLKIVNPDAIHDAAMWVSENASLIDACDSSQLLNELHALQDSDALQIMLGRRPSLQVELHHGYDIAVLLEAFMTVGAKLEVETLLTRSPNEFIDVADGAGVASLLRTYRKLSVQEALEDLSIRAAKAVSFSEPTSIADLIEAFQEVGAQSALAHLLNRNPAEHVILTEAFGISYLLQSFMSIGAQREADFLIGRRPGRHVSLEDANALSILLAACPAIGADSISNDILARDPSKHVELDAYGVAQLLHALRALGAKNEIRNLIARDPERHASSHDSYGFTHLLEALHLVGANEAVAEMLSQRPGRRMPLDDCYKIASLIGAAFKVESVDLLTDILRRNPIDHVSCEDIRAVVVLLRVLNEHDLKDFASSLARKAVDVVPLTDGEIVIPLFHAIHDTGDSDALQRLCVRNLTEHLVANNGREIARFLRTLKQINAKSIVNDVLQRDPARHVISNDPHGACDLLKAFHEIGAHAEFASLAGQLLNHDLLRDSRFAHDVLSTLSECGQQHTAFEVSSRIAQQVSVSDIGAVRCMLSVFRDIDADQALETLIGRIPIQQLEAESSAITGLIEDLKASGFSKEASVLAVRAAQSGNIEDAYAISHLLITFRRLGAQKAIDVLLARRPAAHFDISDSYAAAHLIRTLGSVGNGSHVAEILNRGAVRHINVTDPGVVAEMLDALYTVNAYGAVEELLRRDPARHAGLKSGWLVARLVEVLQEVGAGESAEALLDRHPERHTIFENELSVSDLLRVLWQSDRIQATSTLIIRAMQHAGHDEATAVTFILEALAEADSDDDVPTYIFDHIAERVISDEAHKASIAAASNARVEHGDDDEEAHHPTQGDVPPRLGRNPDGTASAYWDWSSTQ